MLAHLDGIMRKLFVLKAMIDPAAKSEYQKI